MNRNGAEGLPAGPPATPAANEEFTATDEQERRGYARSRRDPYEVWRTRVKAASRRQEAQRDRLR